MYNRVYYTISAQYKRQKQRIYPYLKKQSSHKIIRRSLCSMGFPSPPENPTDLIIITSIIVGMFYSFYK
jgi:hypothetical protein